MKNFKKIISVLAILSLSATAALSAVTVAGCQPESAESKPEKLITVDKNHSATTVSTARGAVESRSSGKVYYVSPEGDSENDGLSWDKTLPIDYLLRSENVKLQAGDTVYVKPGTYSITSMVTVPDTIAGEYNSYIRIVNAALEKQESGYTGTETLATLDFSKMYFGSAERGVQIYGSYIYWYGIDVCGAGDNGLYIGGNYNTIEFCEFYNNRDTGLQLGRSESGKTTIDQWPSYNLIKNCTSHNNYDNETYGENADGFAAKLTVGYGNVFDGCIAYRNSDDGWDLYAKSDSGNIGCVIIYNCVAFENGYLEYTQADNNARFENFNKAYTETFSNNEDKRYFRTRDGDGNGFKLGGSVMEGDVFLYNCLSFNNRMHGVTDNSNPGVLSISNVTAFNNGTCINDDPTSEYFGQIALTGAGVSSDSKSGNINLARQEYSYNLMSHILSVNKDSTTVAADEYRGSVEYSVFDMRSSIAYKVSECIDASNRAEIYAKRGESINAISADIFEKLPADWTIDGENVTYSFNLSGKSNYNVHKTYRNADYSVNMGDLFKVKDYSKLFGDDNKIGAELAKGSWDEYSHYSYFNASNAKDQDDAVVKAATASLDLNTNVNATYQDFDLIVSMQGVSINWETSDPSVIAINTDTPVSPSGTHDARAIVYRQTEDKTVRLTATITHNRNEKATQKKYFDITVKKDVPTIGSAVFQGVEDGRIIIDQYSDAEEPAMFVENAADFNGKLLPKSAYTVDTAVEFSPVKGGHAVGISRFTTDIAGVYNMFKTVRLGDTQRTFNYSIYIASPTAEVNFVGDPAVYVNKNGYSVSGEVTSPTGVLYALTSETKIDDVTAKHIIDNGQSKEFRDDKISFQFESDNSKPYFIYYVMCNLHGDVTSTVKEITVQTQDINSVADFKAMMLENNASTIYMLKTDLDLSGETNWVKEITSQKKPFKGLLNGLGHTISGFTVDASGDKDENETGAMFYRLEGGTIENIKFENIHIKGKQKTGIIATTYGGFLHNIQMRNVYVTGTVRVGGLVGQAMDGDLYVDQISLINDNVFEEVTVTAENIGKDIFYTKDGDKYIRTSEKLGDKLYIRKIDIFGERSAGIVGFIQAGSADAVTHTYISNVYVDAIIGGSVNKYVGSVVGSADDRNVKDYLEITEAISISTLYGNTYVGGILGSHNKGTGAISVERCLFDGHLYYAQDKVEETQLALKNCSGIIGRYIANARANVQFCYARFADHNTDFSVDGEILQANDVFVSLVTDLMKLDADRWTIVNKGNSEYLVTKPYAQLKFLGNWE